MGIDKHLILTLERSVNRHWAMLGGAIALQTPIEKIHFVKGHDNLDYDDDMKRVEDSAEADGFSYIHNFTKGLKNEFVQQCAGAACQAWNYGRILRYIAVGDENCLVTWDDRMITVPFPLIDNIVDEFEDRKEEFYLWQLRVRMGATTSTCNDRIIAENPELIDNVPKYRELMKTNYGQFDEELNKKWESDFQKFLDFHYSGNFIDLPDDYINRHFQKKMIGYSESMVLSPKGASWLLLQALNMKELDSKDDSESGDWWEQEISRRAAFDAWIASDLRIAADKEIIEEKGIYCPKEIGYKYIDDWLPIGSDVNWTNPDHKIDKLRKLTTNINFLEID